MRIFAQQMRNVQRTMSTTTTLQDPSKPSRICKLFAAATAAGFAIGVVDGAYVEIKGRQLYENRRDVWGNTLMMEMADTTIIAVEHGLVGAILGSMFPVTLIVGAVYITCRG
jgi:hypothetical protein